MKKILVAALLILMGANLVIASDDLAEVKARGVLRHLGIPYAGFVTGKGDGLSVEMMQLFAAKLGVKYQFVQTSWENVIADLIGRRAIPAGDAVELAEATPIRGDLISSGFTILPWRQKVVAFSKPTFPTQVWLITTARSDLKPIKPVGNVYKDIVTVKSLLSGRNVLGKKGTCLDPSLYHLKETGAKPLLFNGDLNELAPAVINGIAGAAILDVPDALIALEKWPGEIIIVGPISPAQEMGAAFRRSSPELLRAFNSFYDSIRADGTYLKLVNKYYPAVVEYYPHFFRR